MPKVGGQNPPSLFTWNKDIYPSLVVLFQLAVCLAFSVFIGAHVVAGVFHCCIVNEERRCVVAGEKKGVFQQGLRPHHIPFARAADVEDRVGLQDEFLFVGHNCRRRQSGGGWKRQLAELSVSCGRWRGRRCKRMIWASIYLRESRRLQR